MSEKLIEQWAKEQGFEVWASGHRTVLSNLGKWLERRASVQAPVSTEQIADWLRGYDSDRSATPENSAEKLAKFVGGLAVQASVVPNGRYTDEEIKEIELESQRLGAGLFVPGVSDQPTINTSGLEQVGWYDPDEPGLIWNTDDHDDDLSEFHQPVYAITHSYREHSAPVVPSLEDLVRVYDEAYHDCTDMANEYLASMGKPWPGIEPHKAGIEAIRDNLPSMGYRNQSEGDKSQFNAFPRLIRLTRANRDKTILEMSDILDIDPIRISQLETRHGDPPTESEVMAYVKAFATPPTSNSAAKEAVGWIKLAREGVNLGMDDPAIKISVLQDLSQALAALDTIK